MAMERILTSFKEDRGGGNSGSYDPSDPESYNDYIQAMISDSRSYEADFLAGARDEAQNYYYGYLPALEGAARTSNGAVTTVRSEHAL